MGGGDLQYVHIFRISVFPLLLVDTMNIVIRTNDLKSQESVELFHKYVKVPENIFNS